MKRLLFLVLGLFVGFNTHAQVTATTVAVNTNLVLIGRSTNFFNANANLLTQVYGNSVVVAGGAVYRLTNLSPVDNSAVIQSALNYAFSNRIGSVYISPGWYWFSNTIQMPPFVRLYGAGANPALDWVDDTAISNALAGNTAQLSTNLNAWGATVLARLSNSTGPMVRFNTNIATVNPLFPSNVLNDGTTNTRWQGSFVINGITFFGNNLSNQVTWNQDAIQVDNAWDFEVSDCTFARVRGYIMRAINVNGMRFMRNSSLGSSIWGTKGILHWHGSDSYITDNYIFGGRGPALWISQEGGWLNGAIANNYFGNYDEFGYKTTTNVVSNVMTTSAAHELETGDHVTLYPVTLGDSLPAPLAADVTYYVIKLSDTTYSLSTNHLASSTLTISGAYATPFYVCPGPAVGIYLNDGAKLNTIIGGRCDQNYDQGIRFAGGARNTVVGTSLKQNGYKTSTGAQRTGTNVAGITFTSNANFNATDNRTIGVITSQQFVAREFLGSAADNGPIGPVDNNADVVATDYFASGLTSLNYQQIGATNAGTSLEVSGGLSAANIVRLNRAYTGAIGFALTGNGVNIGTDVASVLLIRDATNNVDLLGVEGFTTVRRLTIGSRSTQSSPKGGQLFGAESATGSNIAGGNLSLYSGLGTGTGTQSAIDALVPVVGSSGSTAQTNRTGLRVQTGTAGQDTDLWLFNADTGTLRRVGATNLTVGGFTGPVLYLK